jgi:hypothetical protein
MDLIITPTDVFHVNWNGETRTYDRVPIPPHVLFNHLYDAIEFEGDITLGRIFSLVSDEPEIWRMILNENVPPFIQEVSKDIAVKEENKDKDETIDYLELYWDAEIEIFEGKKTFRIWLDFHGIGHVNSENNPWGMKMGEDMPFGIGFTPVNELSHLPIRLNAAVSVHTMDLDNHKHNDPLIELGDKDFTLLDVLKGIFWELTWYGQTPEDRDEKKEEVQKACDEAKEMMDKKANTEKYKGEM